MRRVAAAAVLGLVAVSAGASDWLQCVGREPPGCETTWVRSCEATRATEILAVEEDGVRLRFADSPDRDEFVPYYRIKGYPANPA